MIRKKQISFDEALATIKRSRSIVNMNAGFVRQLRAWDRDVRDSDEMLVSPISPKTPVVEIGPMDIIDWRESED